MYFGHRHVETGPSCSHELATFLNPAGNKKVRRDRNRRIERDRTFPISSK